MSENSNEYMGIVIAAKIGALQQKGGVPAGVKLQNRSFASKKIQKIIELSPARPERWNRCVESISDKSSEPHFFGLDMRDLRFGGCLGDRNGRPALMERDMAEQPGDA